MLDLPHYVICEQIHENSRIKVYKGYTSKERIPVIIKALKKEATDPLGISRLMHEYGIIRNLNIEGIVKPMRLEQAGPLFALVMEDVGAVSLRKYIQGCPVNLPSFLEIAVQLTGILGRLHQKGIIHQDLKPENILIHPDMKKVYIIDFGSAILFSWKSKNTLVLNNPVGTLEYMSPEQTGRLNIGIDQRSDIYSLGVVFYEILTGLLPLKAENSAEWVYAHITQKPQPPDEINPDIPRVISDIIMKLLAKAAEERYQSVYGLLWDLKECKRQLVQTGRVEFLPIGRVDVSARFRLPHKLYGREREKEALRAALDDVCEGQAGTILVSGYPGIGKTMLINEYLKPIAMEKGYFIMGKFDQLRQNVPYAPFAAAFENLIKQLMTESQGELDRWKERILRALDRSGAVVTEIIPELECIIGKQPPVDALAPKEAENRFLMVFRDFVRVFALKGHPLVLFLDDLQWADHASINLLKYLTRDRSLYSLLFIGAFRGNEVSDDHPLAGMLEEIHKEQPDRKHISLMPLDWDQVANLVAETLHTESENTTALSEALYRKSGGNPFFLGQLLMLIHNEGLLYFDTQESCWKWELEAIQKLQPGEDVLEFLLKKLQRLPEETREIMKLAACIGNRFDLQTLAAVCGKSLEETASCLMPSVLEGFVLAAADQDINLSQEYPETKPSIFEFLHDRVQQAVYSLIPEDEKKEKHIAIGRLLLQNTARSSIDEKIMSIMDHFNRSLELIHDPAERMELAGYNLAAGQKAKALAAYASALQHFRSGRSLLSDAVWEHAYRLSYNLHLELAQAEYLSGNVEAAEELFDAVIEKAGTELERAGVYGLKVILYAGMGKHTEAVQTGIRALANLGVKLPVHPKKLDYARELLLYKWHMRNKKIEDLVHLPEMKDPVQRKIAELLIRLCYVTITSHPDLYGFIILKTANHAIRYGNSEMASVGYVGYSITAGSVLGNYGAGDRFGRVSIHLVERYGRSSSKCIVYFVIGALISHWTRHAAFGLEYLNKAIRSGMEAGDALTIGYAHLFILEIRYFLGISLEEIEKEILKKHEIAGRLKHDILATNVAIYEKVVSALQGRKAVSLASSAEEFQKEKLQLPQNDQASLATFYFYKMQLCYMAGNYKEALCAAQKVEPLTGTILGFMMSAEYNFYYSLAITVFYDELSFKERKRRWKTLKKNQRQMKKWSEACKANFEHKYLLIAAETARLQNMREEAMSLYDRAICSARENGYIQNEALANELAARFYLSQGLGKIARTYMSDAYDGYTRWGASAKVKELQNRYPELLDGIDIGKHENVTDEVLEKISRISVPGESEIAVSLDKYFIDKAIDNISKETDIDKLFESFLDIAVQSIGADKGCLVVEKNGELFIEAIKDSSSNETAVKTIPLEECHELSKAVVRYVARTLETVVLNHGEQAGIFAGDPYIAESNPRSIACLPLLFQGIPFGVLYLENSFISGVFEPDRLEALKLLSTQIAYAKKLQSYLEEDTVKTEEGAYPNIIDPLTERETEVLKLIAAGLSNKEIAERLEMTVNTVKTHIKNIYGKLQVNRRVQAVERAKELDIL